MVYNRYYLGIWLRVIFLAGIIFLFCLLFFRTNRYYTILVLIIILIGQVWELIHYQNKTNLYLSRFLINIREQNLTVQFDQKHISPSLKVLNKVLSEIQAVVIKANLEKEKQYHYLNYVISTLDIGIITFYPSGKVELFNNAAMKILGHQNIFNIKDLNNISEGMGDFIISLNGGQRRIYKLNHGNYVNSLSFRCGEFRIGPVLMKLVSFQDIRVELEEQELDSWQKLIRVLTHEIMNSITPVNILVQSLIRQFKKSNEFGGTKNMDMEMNGELITGLEMIEERGTSVLEFMEKFRSLTRMPLPQFQLLEVDLVIEKLIRLFRHDFKSKAIKVEYMSLEKSLTLIADEKLLFQSLINLIKNALDAIDNRSGGQILISSGINEDNHTFICINDNGCGIAEDDKDKVFIPFFTTKESGSGIGLSFARQVMRLHKGNINIESEPGCGTIINLLF